MIPLLTIMIPTTVDRQDLFRPLISELWRQIYESAWLPAVDIISMEDDKRISVGYKRQLLLERATGLFVVGFDSDDWPAEDYISSIMGAISNHPNTDHVGFLEHCTIDGKESISCFSSSHLKWEENAHGFDHIRCANPKSVIRRSIALKVGFQDLRYGEDRIFSEAVTPLIKSEVFLNKVLYYYRHTSNMTHEKRYGII